MIVGGFVTVGGFCDRWEHFFEIETNKTYR